MATYAILDDDGNVTNTIVADQAFIDSQGITRAVIIDGWLDGSKGPIDSSVAYDSKAGRFVPNSARIRTEPKSMTDLMAEAVADKVMAAQRA